MTVCECNTDSRNKGGQGFYWLVLKDNKKIERMSQDTGTSCSALGATASCNLFH